MEDRQYSLNDLIVIVQRWFSQLFDEFPFWVMAEISRLSVVKWRVYMDLIELDPKTNRVLAKARWILWEWVKWTKFLQETWLQTKDMKWLKVLLHGKCSFHQEYGFSINIDDFSSEYIIWQLKKKQDDILVQLQKLGILHQNKEKQLWFPIYNIAIVSSSWSQWLQDFEAVLEQSQFPFLIKYYFAAIHGNAAKDEVYHQLQQIYTDIKNWEEISAVVILRWWGGSSGIVWQDDLNIAKWVCHLQVPVMIAIWHTRDKYVLDKIAWHSAKTPTDAWYLFIEKTKNYSDNVEILYRSIQDLIVLKKQSVIQDLDKLILDIRQVWKHKKEVLFQNIKFYYHSIMAVQPSKMNKLWYATIHWSNWKYLSKKDIFSLKSWDDFILKVYDKEMEVLIK